ncbi:MAG: ABC transporter ATP-binding protein [Lachnospiraceae bacterium]|nr:ABC transporter ATP-binding protein [Lachnospiraceae bacterium]
MPSDSCCDRLSPIVSCVNATLGYDNQVVVTDLNFEIFPGDYVSIVGENGSGKSTLMKTMLGLIRPLSGSITINCAKGSGCIGYLPQMSEMQRDFPATVREVVMTGFLNHKSWWPFFSKAEKAQAEEVLKKLRISDLAGRSYRELSGGQQQRVLLARSLLAAHEILMLDEPITGLDPSAAADLYETLRFLNKEDGMTIIMVTHDINSAVINSSKILHVKEHGAFFGTTAQYMASDESNVFFPEDSAIAPERK